MTLADWDALYADLPSLMLKVEVPDRNLIKTENAERRVVSPPGLQDAIDKIVV
jgi:phosphoacetylglucosamine mutase